MNHSDTTTRKDYWTMKRMPAEQTRRELVQKRRDEYVADINAKMDEIKAIIEKHHMSETPNWADVGSLCNILEKLTWLTDSYTDD